ncbi:MAG: hypothetical protein NTX22_00445 [Ignavibacteriales bacterium]|nr:hypothetical protein [Ignavibacteriales bacterium]
MKVNERILKYLSDQLSEAERIKFEAEMKNDSLLQKDVNHCLNRLNELKKINEIEFNATYFVNLVPRMRKTIDTRKSRNIFPKLAYAVPLLAVIISLVFYLNRTNEYSKLVNNLPDSSKDEIVNLIEDENGILQEEFVKQSNNSEIIEKEISNSIEFDKINLDSKLNYTDEDEIIKNLSSEEVETIYNTIVTKKLL